MDCGHRTLDHTADIALEIWAPSEEELLVEGARAIVGLLTEQAQISPSASRELSLDTVDPEDRLVHWLNEVVWLAISEGFLTQEAEIRLRTDGLDARLLGQAAARGGIRTELKSVTYHALCLEKDSNGRFLARVVIDV